MLFRNLQVAWHNLDGKREAIRQRTSTLYTLSQISGYMCLAEMTIYVNITLPDPEYYAMSHTLLMIWGVTCVVAIILNVSIMVLCTLLLVSIQQLSSHEGNEDIFEPESLYSSQNEEGSVMTTEHFEEIWKARYEAWYRRIIIFLWLSMLLFFSLLPSLSWVKNFEHHKSAWMVASIAVLAMVVGAPISRAKLGHILHSFPSFGREARSL